MTISGDSNRQGNRVRPNLYYVDCDLGKPYRSYTDILMNLVLIWRFIFISGRQGKRLSTI